MMSQVLHGIGVSPGAAAGPVVRLAPPPPDPPAGGTIENPELEAERAVAALADVASLLRARGAAAGGTAEDVLEAEAMMAEDPELHEQVTALVTGGRSAARAVHEGLLGFAETLRAIGGYLGERVADLEDIRHRAIALLTGVPMPGVPVLADPSVLVALDLAPADTAVLDPAQVLGFVTELGGPTSHTAILAKQLGIPAVVGCPAAAGLDNGRQVVVDGSAGEVSSTRRRASCKVSRPEQPRARQPPRRPVPVEPPTARTSRCWSMSGRSPTRSRPRLRTRRAWACSAPRCCTSAGTPRRRWRRRSTPTGLCSTPSPAGRSSFAPSMPGRTSRFPSSATGTRRIPHWASVVCASRGISQSSCRTSSPPSPKRRRTVPRTCGSWLRWCPRRWRPLSSSSRREVLACRRWGRWSRCRPLRFAPTGCSGRATSSASAQTTLPSTRWRRTAWRPRSPTFSTPGSRPCSTSSLRWPRAGRKTGRPVGVCGEAASDPLLALVLVGLGVTSLSMAPSSLPSVRRALAAHTLEQCREMAQAVRDADDALSARAAVRSRVDPDLLALL